jgi:predicted secreted acid phosphatase
MATRMQQRKGTAAQWISTNSGQGPVLNAGEIGFEMDTNKFKIGDGVNHWVDLNYFIDGEGALAEITALIDGAPAALNTLNELAAAINDDPSFFTTIATNLSNHQSDTTNIHGIADTSILVTTTGTQTLTNKTITSPSGLVKSDVGLGNVDNTSDANKPISTATQTALDLKANAADITELSQDAVNTAIVAGVGLDKTYDDLANTITLDIDSTVATKAYADQAALTAVDNIVAGAPALLNTLDELAAAMGDDPAYLGTIADNLSALNIDFNDHLGTTTNVHGIADVSLLATKSYVDTAESDAIAAAAQTADTKISDHNSDTTNVHGIANTANLATQSYVTDGIAQEVLDRNSAISAHNDDTLNVHGIANTASLATQSYVDTEISAAIGDEVSDRDNAISTHNSNTTNVHGITDTAALALLTDVSGAISTEVTDRNSAIANAIADEVLDRNSAISAHNDDTLNVHGIADTAALATQSYVDTELSDAIAAEVSDRDIAISAHNDATINVHGIANTQDLATQDYVLDQIAESTVNQSALAGTGLAWDGDNDQFIIDGTVATKTYAAELLTGANKTNIVITGDQNGLFITAENGVADSTTSDLLEGTNLYFTNERAQDAVGLNVGLGLTYTDSTGEIKVNTSEIQARVANVSDEEIGHLNGVTSSVQTQLDSKAPLANPTFTGTVSGINSAMVGLGNVNNTSDANKPVSTAQQTALNLKADLASPALTGVPTAPTASAGTNTTQVATTAFVSGAVSDLVASAPGALNTLNELAVALGNDENFSTSVANSIATKAPIESPAFTGTVSGVTKSMVGLGNVDNTSDANKPVSSATQTALNLKANAADIAELAQDAVNTAIVAGTGLDKTYDDLANTITIDIDSTVTTNDGSQTLTNKTLTSPVINTPTGITKSDVGLANVNNTSDVNKPISTATQTALDAKLASATAATTYAPIANPTFTGTVAGITKSMVGLANVDNTTDAGKPVSTATQTALDLKAPLASPTFTGTVTLPTGTVTSAMILDGTIVNADINASAAIAQSKISNLTSDLAAKLPLAGGTMTGALTLSADPSSSLHAATKQYVDNTASGVVAKPQVLAATSTNLAVTYDNGTAGVGATLTATSNGAWPTTVAGATGWAIGSGLLVKNQTNKAHNGRYFLSNLGSASTPWVLTRCGYCDQANEIPGAYIFVQGGTLAGTGWIQTVANPATFVVGTDNIDVFQFSGSGTYTAGNGLTLTGTEYSIATGAITSGMIADGAVVDADISASAAIAQSKVSGLTSDLAAKAPIANPTFTGTVAGITKSMVGLGNVDNTTDAGKPISTATQTALDLKAPLANPTFTGTVSGVTKAHVGLGNVDNTADADKPVSSATTTALALKANLASPTLTGTPLSTTAAADTNTTQIATTAYVVGQASSSTPVMNGTAAVGTSLKYARADHVHATDTSRAPLASPTFTGSVTLPTGTVTSTMIADGTIVDGDINASAAIAQSKISGLTSDLALKAPLASPALTGTPTAPTATAGTNTTQVATTAFVGTAVANLVASAPSALDTLNELATALGNDASFSTTVTNSIATKAPIASPTFTGTATIPTLTLTNPLSAANGGTGLSSLGTGVATFLGTPSSANLAAMITDEIGTGNIVLSEIATNAQTASYTLVAADRGKLVEMNVASANTLTVPLNSTVPFPIGTQIDLLQVGAGKTTIAGAAGVTVNATPGLAIRAQWGGATLIKRAENTWVLIGDLTV